jgi:hypothetical protein
MAIMQFNFGEIANNSLSTYLLYIHAIFESIQYQMYGITSDTTWADSRETKESSYYYYTNTYDAALIIFILYRLYIILLHI